MAGEGSSIFLSPFEKMYLNLLIFHVCSEFSRCMYTHAFLFPLSEDSQAVQNTIDSGIKLDLYAWSKPSYGSYRLDHSFKYNFKLASMNSSQSMWDPLTNLNYWLEFFKEFLKPSPYPTFRQCEMDIVKARMECTSYGATRSCVMHGWAKWLGRVVIFLC